VSNNLGKLAATPESLVVSWTSLANEKNSFAFPILRNDNYSLTIPTVDN
jgi:hypothetical protein